MTARTVAEGVLEQLSRDGTVDDVREEELLMLCEHATNTFSHEPAMITVTAPLHIFGDLHGQYADLQRLFRIVGRPPTSRCLFLGDYVDRCHRGLEIVSLLFAYKVLYPSEVLMLRGNHECAKMNRIYGFYEECRRRRSVRLWKAVQRTFDQLPLVAVVNARIICMHGGISPHINGWHTLANMKKPVSPEECDQGLALDLMWSDPTSDACGGFDYNGTRRTSVIYDNDAIHDMCQKLDLDLIVRAHEVAEQGHRFQADERLCTVFSAPNYCGFEGNSGSVMRVEGDLRISFDTLRPRPVASLTDEQRTALANQICRPQEPNSPNPSVRQRSKVPVEDDEAMSNPTPVLPTDRLPPPSLFADPRHK